MYADELSFRQRYPELHKRNTRVIGNIPSYDINGNEAYVKAFALESKSLQLFHRGQLQVSFKPVFRLIFLFVVLPFFAGHSRFVTF